MKNTKRTVNPNLKPWRQGESGNPAGRPPTGLAIAELARSEVDKHALVAKLGDIAASGRGPNKLRAIELLLAYAYGRPRSDLSLQHSGSIGKFDLQEVRAYMQSAPDIPD